MSDGYFMAFEAQAQMQEAEPVWWQEYGYVAGRRLDDHGHWVCVTRMIFTWRLMLCTERDVLDHYCYHTLTEALQAWATWDGKSDAQGQWIRHHGSGRRRLEDGSIVIAP